MTPKFLTLNLFRSGTVLEDARDEIMVNPRRVDSFQPVPPPTAYPGTYWGTRVRLGSKQSIVVRETLTQIKRLLK